MTGCAAPERELLSFAAAGTLEGDETARVSAHARSCPECGPELEALRHLAREMRTLHLTEGEVVEAAWSAAVPPHADECSRCRAEIELVRQSVRELRGAEARPRRLVPSSVAAALAVVALGLGAWNASLVRDRALLRELSEREQAESQARVADAERRAGEAQDALRARSGPEAPPSPAVNVPIVDLEPARARGAAAPATVRLARDTAWVALVLAAPPGAGSSARELVVTDASGHVVLRVAGLRPTPYETFTVALPAPLLPGGRYDLRLAAPGQPDHVYVLVVSKP